LIHNTDIRPKKGEPPRVKEKKGKRQCEGKGDSEEKSRLSGMGEQDPVSPRKKPRHFYCGGGKARRKSSRGKGVRRKGSPPRNNLVDKIYDKKGDFPSKRALFIAPVGQPRLTTPKGRPHHL